MNVNRHPKLTVAKVKAAKPGRHHDGHGLMLFVKPSGSRSWIQRIVVQGKRIDMGLGSFPLVSLAEAREAAIDNRRIARKGGDPRVRRSIAPTFKSAAWSVHAIHTPGMKNPRDRRKWIADVENHAFPILGERPVDQIDTSEVMSVLIPIWTSKPNVAKRVKQRISLVMRWAIAEGHRSDNPAGDALDTVLSRQTTNGNGTKHMPSIPYTEVASAIAAVRASATRDPVKMAFEFLVLTAGRSIEIREARWSEIDINARVWTIPGARMKAGIEHRVPLSDSALARISHQGG